MWRTMGIWWLLLLTLPGAAEEHHWALVRGDVAARGVETLPGVTPPLELYSQMDNPFGWTSPIVVSPLVFVGSGDHRLYALAPPLKRGLPPTVLWQFETGGNLEAAPAFANGVVYVGARDHFLYALSAGEGRLLWRQRLGGDIRAAPIVYGPLVVVGCDDHSVYALDRSSGRIVWRAETGGDVRGPAAAEMGRVFVGSTDHYLYALRATDGSVAWKAPLGENLLASTAVAEGRVYATTAEGTLHAFEAVNGRHLWTADLRVHPASSPAILNSLLLVTTISGNLRALDASTGRSQWEFTSGELTSSPVVVGRYVYVATAEGKVAYTFASPDAPERDPAVRTVALSHPGAAGEMRPGCWKPPRAFTQLAPGRGFLCLVTGKRLILFISALLPLAASSPTIWPGGTGSSLGFKGCYVDSEPVAYQGLGPPQQDLAVLRQRLKAAHFGPRPARYLMSGIDLAATVLDGRLSYASCGGELNYLWYQRWGHEPYWKGVFGIGDHLMLLLITDEEGKMATTLTTFRVVPPAGFAPERIEILTPGLGSLENLLPELVFGLAGIR